MSNEVVVPGVGDFRWLPNLEVWESTARFQGVSVVLAASTAEHALQLASKVPAALGRRVVLEPIARAHLQQAYGASDEDMDAIELMGLELAGDEVTLVFDLPEGSPVEYLTVVFSTSDEPVRSAGGNY